MAPTISGGLIRKFHYQRLCCMASVASTRLMPTAASRQGAIARHEDTLAIRLGRLVDT